MRLDSYLVETGRFTSRGRAKRAIIEGCVKINSQVITKPSFDAVYSDIIEITGDMDKPAGYLKLKTIQEKTSLIKKDDTVLDAGSSAGGFLLFASEIASTIHGIEFSHEFKGELEKIALKRSNITIEFSDVFTITPEKEKYDVLLLDITVSPEDSIKALMNLLPALKKGGRLLWVLKTPENMDIESILDRLVSMGFEIIQKIEAEKMETYMIARKL